MWEVYIYSGKVTHHFVECESEKAAEEFCDAYGYTYVDENAFDIPFRTVQAGCMLIDELDHRAGQVRMFAGENKNRQLGRGI